MLGNEGEIDWDIRSEMEMNFYFKDAIPRGRIENSFSLYQWLKLRRNILSNFNRENTFIRICL